MAKHERLLTRADLRRMTPEDVAKATTEGRLRHLLAPESITGADVATWHADDVLEAKEAGRLRHLGIEPDEPTSSGADQGARGPQTGTRDRLRTLTASEVRDALNRGDFDLLLSGEGGQP
jgi:hypothetical protein